MTNKAPIDIIEEALWNANAIASHNRDAQGMHDTFIALAEIKKLREAAPDNLLVSIVKMTSFKINEDVAELNMSRPFIPKDEHENRVIHAARTLKDFMEKQP